MAELTTVDGGKFTFDPASIVALADHDANSGQAVTCIYGLSAGQLKINEPAGAFLDRIGIASSFAKLTRPNGSLIWINGKAVSTLRAPLPGEYVSGVQTVISVGSLTQGVTEDMAAARVAINACRGKDSQL